MKTKSLLSKAKQLPKSGRPDRAGWWIAIPPSQLEEVHDLLDAYVRGELSEQFLSHRALRTWLKEQGLPLTDFQLRHYLHRRKQLREESDRQSEIPSQRTARKGRNAT